MKASMKYATAKIVWKEKRSPYKERTCGILFSQTPTKRGAKLYISDIYSEKAKLLAAEVGAEIVAPEHILSSRSTF